MKGAVLLVGLLCVFSCQAAWIDTVKTIENYTGMFTGFFTGLFSEYQDAGTASCFDNTKNLYDFIYKIYDATQEDYKFIDYVKMGMSVIDFVVQAMDDCTQVGSSFKQIFDEFQVLFNKFDVYWQYITENFLVVAFNFSGDFGYIKNRFEDKKWTEAGEKIGEVVYEFFLNNLKQAMENNGDVPEPTS